MACFLLVMLNLVQHDVMKTKGQQCSTTIILNLFQDLSEERDSKGSRQDAEICD